MKSENQRLLGGFWRKYKLGKIHPKFQDISRRKKSVREKCSFSLFFKRDRRQQNQLSSF